MILLLLAGCADKGSGAVQECAIDAPADGGLEASGTRLVDSAGRAVSLRGINAGGRSKFAPYAPFDFDQDDPDAYQQALEIYLDRAASWGFDVLRVPFSWEGIEPAPGVSDDAVLERSAALLDGAWERRIWTVVDFHQDVYAEAYCGDGFPAWTLDDPPENHHDCADWFNGYFFDDDVLAAFDAFWADAPVGAADQGVRAAFEAMWDAQIARHADRPGVIGYEVINEPSEGTADGAIWSASTLPDFYTDMAARMRAADPDALVFFDLSGLDAVTATTDVERPAGDGLVFAPHFYDPVLVVPDAEPSADVAAGLESWAALGAAWDLPVFVGEMGLQHTRDGVTDFARAHFEAMDALGIHGAWWEYSASDALWNFEDLSVVEPDGTERPELLDGIVRPYVRALAGESLVFTFDPETLAVSLSYTGQAEGVTELVLPERLYRGRPVAVSGSGGCVEQDGARLLIQATGGEVNLELSP